MCEVEIFYAVQGMRRDMYTSHAITHRISSRCRHVFACICAKGTENLAEENSEQIYKTGKDLTFAAVTEMLRRVSPFKSHGCSELSGRPVPRHEFHNTCHSFQNMLQKHTLDARFNASMLQCPFAIL